MKKITLKDKLIDFLQKLNDGKKILLSDIEDKYKKVIDLLYTVENFPVDNSDDNIYCFTKSD